MGAHKLQALVAAALLQLDGENGNNRSLKNSKTNADLIKHTSQ